MIAPAPVPRVGRGAFLAGLAASAALVAGAPRPALAAGPKERVLWLKRLDWDEEARVPFTLDGRTEYVPGYNALCWVLRDHQVDPKIGYVRFDIVTMEVLWEVQQILHYNDIKRPMIVHSGYRSPQTNARTEGAVRNSQHLRARAVDFHVDGVSVADLWRLCYSRSLAGGLGYYPAPTGRPSDEGWVHLDSWERRYWVGSTQLHIPGHAMHPALVA